MPQRNFEGEPEYWRTFHREGEFALPAVKLHFETIKPRIIRARELSETRELLADLLVMPDARLLQIFGVSRWQPREVHGLKDRIFAGVVGELARNGWKCDSASFGTGRRDTFLMEMARRGFAQTVDCLLSIGADADYNTRGYGDSTALMAACDPNIMRKLLKHKANPMEVNASNETDFTYKLLSGLTTGARFYLYNTGNIPFQPLLDNFRDCVLSRRTVPYNPMFPLCLVPVVPEGVHYRNIVDEKLVDAMFRNQYLPFSSKALACEIDSGLTVWHYIRTKMKNAREASPALLTAYLACMSKKLAFQTPSDFACVEEYLEKPLPRDLSAQGVISKSLFVHMLFSLGGLSQMELLRWLLLLGKVNRRIAFWMDFFGEEPFRVTNSSRLMDNRRGDTHVLQELSAVQSLLSLRVGVSDNFGEFPIPEGLSNPTAGGSQQLVRDFRL